MFLSSQNIVFFFRFPVKIASIHFVSDTSVTLVVCGGRDNTIDSDVPPSDSDHDETDETIYDDAHGEDVPEDVTDQDYTNIPDDVEPHTTGTSKNKQHYRWRNILKKGHDMVANPIFTDSIQIDAIETKTSIQYFKMFFDDEMLAHVAHHTNLYSSQQ